MRPYPAHWRGAWLALALLYLAGQIALALHEVQHLSHGDPGPCLVCDLAGAPALPAIVPPLPKPASQFIPAVREQAPPYPFTRLQRVHLPRAPPSLADPD